VNATQPSLSQAHQVQQATEAEIDAGKSTMESVAKKDTATSVENLKGEQRAKYEAWKAEQQ
jgi:hypothetical protein